MFFYFYASFAIILFHSLENVADGESYDWGFMEMTGNPFSKASWHLQG